MINQLSVFIQNSSGRLAAVTKILADANVNIRALSVADSTDFGILRLIVSNLDDATAALKANNRIFDITPVIGVSIADTPGGLAKIAQLMADNEVDIEYFYAFVSHAKDGAYLVLRVQQTEIATKVLENNGFTLLCEDDIQTL